MKSLGQERNSRRIPHPIRRQAIEYTRRQRTRGRNRSQISRLTGVSTDTLRRWITLENGRQRKQPRSLVAVQVTDTHTCRPGRSEDLSDRAGQGLVLVSPSGFRLEGLSVDDAVRTMGVLG